MAPPASAYDFTLPPRLIAQHPPKKRDGGRLLNVDDGIHPFAALPALLREGDLLVFNASKVLPARLCGTKASGGKVEMLLERLLGGGDCLVQIGASKPPASGAHIGTAAGAFAVCGREGAFYHLRAIGKNGRAVSAARRFQRHGSTPLPPYIRRRATAADRRRYQTVYADTPGSVAAPTAGLHFSKRLLAALAAAGIGSARLHLHVGAGTFMPLREGQATLHSERYHIGRAAIAAIEKTQKRGGRVVAVGTTTLRALESAADSSGRLKSGAATTSLFIRPGTPFRVADALITNFHLPRSSLFMLVCAFGGSARLQAAYQQAIAADMRFYSYGDAMLLTAA